ncbi:MAG: isocitrate/isopropylmalate dehydrogenase family protein [Aigarchaeota archaeon]|nr:isocitrate/isopropylmalate dehydrogenase family protein [Aigarchaeota archaeon]MDW8093203.1 isocitrate/isopropylmalate dehydrogenase family protein [Nitrososphaerota archaeon]
MKRVALIKGDGTGPELTEATLKVLDRINPGIEITLCDAGYEWWLSAGRPSVPNLIPEQTWEILRSSDACLKSPTTTPPEPDTPKSVAVSIRRHFDLYANIRPIKTFRSDISPMGEVDFLCIREATEDLYIGAEAMLDNDTAIAIRKVTKHASSRIARRAFEEAAKRKWKKVVIITKRNIMKLTDSVFYKAAEEVSKSYDISLEEYYIDNVCQQLVKNPQRFNQSVLLSTNIFMDIVSELASGLIGNIGLVYSANIGDRYAMFEPAHGSVPKYKGMYVVNPTATILSAAWMLEYLGFARESKAIYDATLDVIKEGRFVTRDLGGNSSTLEMADEIAKRTEKFLSGV